MDEGNPLAKQLAELGVAPDVLAQLDESARTVVSAMIERTTYRIGVATAGTDYTRGYAVGLSQIMAGIWHRAPEDQVLHIQPPAPLPTDVDTVARLAVIAGLPPVRGVPGWRLKATPDAVITEPDISSVRGIRENPGTLTGARTVDVPSRVDDDEDDDAETCDCINCSGCNGDGCDDCEDRDCDYCHRGYVSGGGVDSCCGHCDRCDRCHQCSESGEPDSDVYTQGDRRYCVECEHHCEPCRHNNW